MFKFYYFFLFILKIFYTSDITEFVYRESMLLTQVSELTQFLLESIEQNDQLINSNTELTNCLSEDEEELLKYENQIEELKNQIKELKDQDRVADDSIISFSTTTIDNTIDRSMMFDDDPTNQDNNTNAILQNSNENTNIIIQNSDDNTNTIIQNSNANTNILIQNNNAIIQGLSRIQQQLNSQRVPLVRINNPVLSLLIPQMSDIIYSNRHLSIQYFDQFCILGIEINPNNDENINDNRIEDMNEEQEYNENDSNLDDGNVSNTANDINDEESSNDANDSLNNHDLNINTPPIQSVPIQIPQPVQNVMPITDAPLIPPAVQPVPPPVTDPSSLNTSGYRNKKSNKKKNEIIARNPIKPQQLPVQNINNGFSKNKFFAAANDLLQKNIQKNIDNKGKFRIRLLLALISDFITDDLEQNTKNQLLNFVISNFESLEKKFSRLYTGHNAKDIKIDRNIIPNYDFDEDKYKNLISKNDIVKLSLSFYRIRFINLNKFILKESNLNVKDKKDVLLDDFFKENKEILGKYFPLLKKKSYHLTTSERKYSDAITHALQKLRMDPLSVDITKSDLKQVIAILKKYISRHR